VKTLLEAKAKTGTHSRGFVVEEKGCQKLNFSSTTCGGRGHSINEQLVGHETKQTTGGETHVVALLDKTLLVGVHLGKLNVERVGGGRLHKGHLIPEDKQDDQTNNQHTNLATDGDGNDTGAETQVETVPEGTLEVLLRGELVLGKTLEAILVTQDDANNKPNENKDDNGHNGATLATSTLSLQEGMGQRGLFAKGGEDLVVGETRNVRHFLMVPKEIFVRRLETGLNGLVPKSPPPADVLGLKKVYE